MPDYVQELLDSRTAPTVTPAPAAAAQPDFVQELIDTPPAPAAPAAAPVVPPQPTFEQRLGPINATDLLAPTATPLQFGQWIPAASLHDLSKAVTERAHQTPGGLPLAVLSGAGLSGLGARVLSSDAGKIATAIGLERALEGIIPDDWRHYAGQLFHALSSAGH